MSDITPDVVVDARGAACPGPLMELVGKIRQGDPGTVYELQTTDNSSSHDVPEWVDDTGNELLGIDEHDDYWSIFVEKV